jgi:hypothetical protein
MEVSRCPLYGFEVVTPSKEWRYSMFDIKNFRCPNCGSGSENTTTGGFLKFILVPSEKGRARKFDHHTSLTPLQTL